MTAPQRRSRCGIRLLADGSRDVFRLVWRQRLAEIEGRCGLGADLLCKPGN